MRIGSSLAIYTNTIGSRPTYWGSQYVGENIFDFLEFALVEKNLLHAVLFFLRSLSMLKFACTLFSQRFYVNKIWHLKRSILVPCENVDFLLCRCLVDEDH